MQLATDHDHDHAHDPGPVHADAAARVHALPGGRDAALALSGRLDELTERQRIALFREQPEWTVERPDLREPQEAIVRGSLRDQLETLRTGAELPDACPPWDREMVRLAVSVATPLGPLVTTYRTGSALLLDAWMEEVERLDPERDQRLALLRAGSRFFSSYAGRLSKLVIVAYRDEREAGRRSADQRRAEAVQALLADPDADAGGLGHDLDLSHLALVAWGPGAERAVRELARVLDRAPLLVAQAEGTWWAWLSGRPGQEEETAARLADWRPPAGVRVALGGEHAGRAGFRDAHREARDAHRAAIRRDGAVTRYADVALELLASADEAAARRFVSAELRALDGPGARPRALRETLAAYFRAGHNAAATARELGVHEQTVVNRLRAVEAATGTAVASRRAELETALRLRRHLERRGGAGRAPGPPQPA